MVRNMENAFIWLHLCFFGERSGDEMWFSGSMLLFEREVEAEAGSNRETASALITLERDGVVAGGVGSGTALRLPSITCDTMQ